MPRVDVMMIGFGEINFWLPQSPEQIRQGNAEWLAASQMTQEQVDQVESWLQAHETACAYGYRIKTHAYSLKAIEQCRNDLWRAATGEAEPIPPIPEETRRALYDWLRWQERYLKYGDVLKIAPTDPATGETIGCMIFLWNDN